MEENGKQPAIEPEIVMQPDFSKFLDSLTQDQTVFLSLMWATQDSPPEDVTSAQMCYSVMGALLTVRLQKMMEVGGEKPLIDSMMQAFFTPVTDDELNSESEGIILAQRCVSAQAARLAREV